MAADGDSNNDPEMLESDTDDSINVVEDISEEPSWVSLAQRAAQGMQVMVITCSSGYLAGNTCSTQPRRHPLALGAPCSWGGSRPNRQGFTRCTG